MPGDPVVQPFLILNIAIKSPLRKTFDYLPLPELPHSFWQLGMRVNISFGRRELVGVIVGIAKTSAFPIEKLKKITGIIDEVPLIDATLLSLYQWASDYYQHSLGDVIIGSLPKKIRDGQVISFLDNKIEGDIVKSLPEFGLSIEQQTAITAISAAEKFQPFLLAGVTGSGKTEVYLHVIAHVLRKNQQALLLVPEISLTPQTVARFEARFSAPVLLLHSGLSDGKRLKAWLQSLQNSPCIVIGTRSAVFAPLKNCGVIVIDEEHDSSFKQHSGFRYSARDVAVMRAKLSDIPIVLGSATPALESLKNVNQKKYHLFHLTRRAGNAHLPAIILHNICREKLQYGLSPRLIEVMHQHLNAKNQVLLFLNRRGYAPVLLCHQCGWSSECPHCDARMTVHDQPKRLLCHHCGHQQKLMRVCESCCQSELMEIGLGTERLEETIKNMFPHKTICRVDRDSVKNFSALEEILSKVHSQEIDILIGTQMLVKGHHFENVTLVAALDVDHALFSGDFRAIEKMGQSLIQVAGRAGRAEKKGEVFVQTHHPDHPLLKKLFEKNYFEFANTLLEERLQTQLPPFVHLVMLRAEAKSKIQVYDFLEAVKNKLSTSSACEKKWLEINGPFPSLMARKAGVHRAQLFLQSSNRSVLKSALSHFLESVDKQKKSTVKWIIDVDPVEI